MHGFPSHAPLGFPGPAWVLKPTSAAEKMQVLSQIAVLILEEGSPTTYTFNVRFSFVVRLNFPCGIWRTHMDFVLLAREPPALEKEESAALCFSCTSMSFMLLGKDCEWPSGNCSRFERVE